MLIIYNQLHAIFKKTRPFWIVCLVASSFYVVERACHHVTGGFTLVQISENHPYNPKWDLPKPSASELNEITAILSQPYRFHFSGGQSYVFVSSDEQYILKITKYKHLRIPLIFKWLPLKGKLQAFRESAIEKKKLKLQKTFDSYLLANQLFKEESGIIYMHLAKTNYLKQNLTLIDNIGIQYEINLDDYEFILQKRCILTFPYLDQLLLENKELEAKLAVKKLIFYFAKRLKLGIEDHDISFGMNFGFREGKPFQLDIGSLRRRASYAKEPLFSKKLQESITELRSWAEKSHPELVPTIDETVNEICLTSQ